jgi:hypothetical protein
MFNDFNRISGHDMNWFFKNWFFDNGYIDLAVAGVSTSHVERDGGITTKVTGAPVVTIQNIGAKAIPFNLVVTYTDGTSDTIHETAAIWQADQRTASINIPTTKTIKSVTLDGGIYMDANPDDNKWEAK